MHAGNLPAPKPMPPSEPGWPDLGHGTKGRSSCPHGHCEGCVRGVWSWVHCQRGERQTRVATWPSRAAAAAAPSPGPRGQVTCRGGGGGAECSVRLTWFAESLFDFSQGIIGVAQGRGIVCEGWVRPRPGQATATATANLNPARWGCHNPREHLYELFFVVVLSEDKAGQL